MHLNRLRISLVIPVYNEERHLADCLRAACAQAIPFFEIIVVDNNSTDASAAIARRFKHVTVICESHQGKVYARTAGFDAARGDIIARIDADTVLPTNWNTVLQTILAESNTDAVSGLPRYYDIAWPKIGNAIERFFRRHLAYALRETLFLQGANMAIKRHAWQRVRSKLCGEDRSVHEDFDIAIHLQELGHVVTYDERLLAGLSARCVDVSFLFFVGYIRMNTRSYASHNIRHYRRMYPVIVAVLILFWPARILFRGRDPRTGKLSLAQLLSPKLANARMESTGGVYLS